MRKPSFHRFVFEELERRDMLNMILGQLGTPGSVSANSNAPGLEVPAIAVVQQLNDAIPSSWLVADGTNFTANIASPGCALLTNPAMAINDQQATTSGSSETSFDPFSQNCFDIGLSGQTNQSVVLGGGGESTPAG